MEHALQFLGPSGLRLAQVALRVFERVSEHEEPVSDRFELLAGDDELVLAEAELEGTAPGFEVALSTRLLAVQPRSSPAGRDRERPSAPPTRRLRHSDDFTSPRSDAPRIPQGYAGEPGFAALGRGLTSTRAALPAPIHPPGSRAQPQIL